MIKATKKRSSSSRTRHRRGYISNPQGVIQPRVERVGPERFGILAVDCAKARSKWMLCNFYGKVIVPPTVVEHNAAGLQATVAAARAAVEQAGLLDTIVAIEMTGVYHRPIQRAFRDAKWDTRVVHPYASKHYRGLMHPNLKTDDHDLEAIFQAAVSGFGMRDLESDEVYQQLQLVSRHRRNLVEQRARLQVQIRVYLERTLPGYASLFEGDCLWSSPVAIPLARWAEQPSHLVSAGVAGMAAHCKQLSLRCHGSTLERIRAWADSAAKPDPLHATLRKLWLDLDDHRVQLSRKIQKNEVEMASLLVRTPYLLLLSAHGLNIVTAGDLAGELGSIEHYPNARAISGRAGLYPTRYQSDNVDRCDGPIARSANMRLRAAWLRLADCLLKCNYHYQAKYEVWHAQGVDSRDIRVRCANRATRMVYQIVAGRQLYQHCNDQRRQYLLSKLLDFYREHEADSGCMLRDMQTAVAMLPPTSYAEQAKPLVELAQRRPGQAQPLSTLLLAVLERLGITRQQIEQVQSEMTEAQKPR